jgi:hypothetical protein
MEAAVQSSEHRYIGDQVTVPAGRGLPLSPDGRVQLVLAAPTVSAVTLTYGQIVALGGDLYGTPGELPISAGGSLDEQLQLFRAAHATLVAGDRAELARILQLLDFESSRVLGTSAPAAAFAALGHELDCQWNEATGGAPASQGLLGLTTQPGRYMRLASRNLDHFGADAVAAYRAGHTAACLLASTDLNAALAMNAHADHFLSDLFASGHIRTPRRVLNDYAWNLSEVIDRVTIGALLSRAMHDEENAQGLVVTSAARPGRSWSAFGDSQALEPKAAENAQEVVAALQVSVDEVLAGQARPGGAPAFAALQYVPYVAGDYPPTGGPSIAPMLVAVGREPLARTGVFWGIPTPGLGKVDDYHYTGDFLWQSVVADTLGRQFIQDLPNGIFVWLSK